RPPSVQYRREPVVHQHGLRQAERDSRSQGSLESQMAWQDLYRRHHDDGRRSESRRALLPAARRRLRQEIIRRSKDRRQFTDWLVRGTQPICLNCREDDVRPLEKEGFKVQEIFELSDVTPGINGSPWMLSVANRAPHPNAAKVFANWIAGKEGL